MPEYEYGRIGTLSRKLEEAGVAAETIAAIMEGGEKIRKTDKPEKKADWMRGCMARMDSLLDEKTRRSVREACACCLGGKRLQLSKAIGKAGGTLAERIARANQTPFVFGHSVELLPDGRIIVRFQPDPPSPDPYSLPLTPYRCVCLPKSREPVSETYCYCCGGHIKHHLQIALGEELECEVRTSALSSGGKHPCSFLFRIWE